MLHFLFISFLMSVLTGLIALLIWLLFKVSSLSFTGAPYIEIPSEVLPHIVKALEIKEGSFVYDLGCGDGRVLIEAYKSNPEAIYVGVDNALLPIVVARRKLEELGLSNKITIVKENFFHTDLSKTTHIFLYLYPKLVNSLFVKLLKELKPGTRVVTCDYTFNDKRPAEVIDLARGPGNLGKFLYVYLF